MTIDNTEFFALTKLQIGKRHDHTFNSKGIVRDAKYKFSKPQVFKPQKQVVR